MAKILIYGMNYAPEVAGVGRYTGEIGEHLAAEGHDVTVVTTPPHYPAWKIEKSHRPFRWTTERRGRETVIRCPLYLHKQISGIWRLVAPLTFAISSTPVVLWHILIHRPDTVLCVEPTLMGAPAALIAAGLVGCHRVLHVQDLEIDAAFAVGHLRSRGKLKRLALAFERSCLRRFNKVVTISEKMAERLAAKGVERVHIEIIRNWVDIDHIRPLSAPSAYRDELNIAATDKIVLYSGSIGAKQGFETVIAAAKRLTSQPQIKFIFAGEGPARASVEAATASLPNVRFLPFQPYDRLSEFLGLADVHLMPQSSEAADLVLPSKLGGMLASGKPIVATAPQNTELALFLSTAATIVPPGDPDAMAAAISAALLGQRDPFVGRDARLRLASLLSRQDALTMFERLLSGLRLDGNNRPSVPSPIVQTTSPQRPH